MAERRWDPVAGEWRIFAAHRQDRTFLPPAEFCPLCPTRPGADPTEVPEAAYQLVVFDNRFPALLPRPPEPTLPSTPLYQVAASAGAAEVVLYSDRHDVTFAGLAPERVRRLVELWADRYAVLGGRDEVAYVFVFENKGEVIGVTLEHPHGQIYGFPDIPPRPLRKLKVAARHLERNGTCVHCDVVAHEAADGVRIVARNHHFLAFVPFAARFPYELQVVTYRHATSLLDLTDPERDSLAAILLEVARTYDALFGFSLPYVMGMHQAPTDDGEWLSVSHFHVEFTPFHRTADRLKYLAGAELVAGAFLNDTVPEASAAALRAAAAHLAGAQP